MARGINKVILVGNLGGDPETRYTAGGNAVTNITIATSETWKDKQTGNQEERTEWHRVVFFNKLAEIAGEYLRKGSQVYVEGSLRTRKWQDQNGQDRYTTEIVASEMQMMGGRSSGGDMAQQQYNAYQADAGNDQQQAQPQQPQQSAPNGRRNANGTMKSPHASQQPSNGPQAPNFDDFDDDIPF